MMSFDLLITLIIAGVGIFSSSIFMMLKKSLSGESTFWDNLKEELGNLDDDPESQDTTLLENFRNTFQEEQAKHRPKRNAQKGNRNNYKKAKRNQRSGLNSQELHPVESSLQNTSQKRKTTFKQSGSSEFDTVRMKRETPSEKPKKLAVKVNTINSKKLREAIIYKEILDKPKTLR